MVCEEPKRKYCVVMTDIEMLTHRIIAFRDARDWKQFPITSEVSHRLNSADSIPR